jgi:hypothetical protein
MSQNRGFYHSLERARAAVARVLKSTPQILDATAGMLRKPPIEAGIGWLGRLHEVAVPRAVVPNPSPSPCGPANINILFDLLERTQSVEGDIAECGVFRGRTLVSMALWLQQHRIPKHVFGFDSFAGFPDEAMQIDLALGGADLDDKKLGGYSSTSHEALRRKIKRFGIENTVTLEPGAFSDSLMRQSNARFSFVHLDCDLYESYKDCLEFFLPGCV